MSRRHPSDRAAAPLRRFRIVETCAYVLHAPSLEEARRAFLQATPSKRDGRYFQEVLERTISQEESH